MTGRTEAADPAASTDVLDAIAGRLCRVLRRLGWPGIVTPATATSCDPALDMLTRPELTALSAQLGRSYLAELDRHLAAGRLLDLEILEQRAG
jgi:hypothetical protein